MQYAVIGIAYCILFRKTLADSPQMKQLPQRYHVCCRAHFQLSKHHLHYLLVGFPCSPTILMHAANPPFRSF